jgi:5-methylcytosine-specific restriction protein A
VIDAPDRNPAWSRDELILALDLYMTNPASPPGKGSSEVAALSDLLNKMHRLNGINASPTLRNENGVYLKMMNLRALDPMFTAQGKVGMQSGGAQERIVWADYTGRRAELAADANAIRDAVARADETALAKLPQAEPYEGEEGGVIIRLHKRYERDPKLVREKREAAKASGVLVCEVCGFDFKAAYGDLGEGYIEVHHLKPVHTLKPGAKTKLEDLALLCANCHRMTHRERLPVSVEKLKSLVALRKAYPGAQPSVLA